MVGQEKARVKGSNFRHDFVTVLVAFGKTRFHRTHHMLTPALAGTRDLASTGALQMAVTDIEALVADPNIDRRGLLIVGGRGTA
eukprot:11534060-Alexandrium_andersonii.AAC.1